jgi:hypothetical protein
VYAPLRKIAASLEHYSSPAQFARDILHQVSFTVTLLVLVLVFVKVCMYRALSNVSTHALLLPLQLQCVYSSACLLAVLQLHASKITPLAQCYIACVHCVLLTAGGDTQQQCCAMQPAVGQPLCSRTLSVIVLTHALTNYVLVTALLYANIHLLQQMQLLVCLPGQNIRALTSTMPVVQLLRHENMQLHAVRLVELSDRFSADMAAANSQRTLMVSHIYILRLIIGIIVLLLLPVVLVLQQERPRHAAGRMYDTVNVL